MAEKKIATPLALVLQALNLFEQEEGDASVKLLNINTINRRIAQIERDLKASVPPPPPDQQ